jgi:hypothetical protein
VPKRDVDQAPGALLRQLVNGYRVSQARTVDEYAALFAAAGLRLAGATPTAPGLNVIEAAPA